MTGDLITISRQSGAGALQPINDFQVKCCATPAWSHNHILGAWQPVRIYNWQPNDPPLQSAILWLPSAIFSAGFPSRCKWRGWRIWVHSPSVPRDFSSLPCRGREILLHIVGNGPQIWAKMLAKAKSWKALSLIVSEPWDPEPFRMPTSLAFSSLEEKMLLWMPLLSWWFGRILLQIMWCGDVERGSTTGGLSQSMPPSLQQISLFCWAMGLPGPPKPHKSQQQGRSLDCDHWSRQSYEHLT